MAYTKTHPIKRLSKCLDYVQDKEKTTPSLSAAIDYALNRDKTESTCFETAINCKLEAAYQDMLDTKQRWDKAGCQRQGYHIIQSFAPGEVTPEVAHAVGVEFAQRLLGDRYEVIVTTHLNKAHLHNHIVFNSVSFLDGAMYRDQFKDYFVGIRGTSDAICQERGLSIIEPDESKQGRHYSEWTANQTGRPTIREAIRREIDAILRRSYTYKTFLEELRRRGYDVKNGPNVKHTAVRPPGSQKYIRLDSLGAGYTEAELKARLAAIRSGEAPPSAPSSSAPPSTWLNPGRRYYVRGGVPQRRPRKLRGFQALCYYYLYLLRGVQKGRPHTRAALSTWQEVVRFHRYQEQFLYLHRNRIETAEQLAMQYDALQAEIDALTDRRAGLYRLRRDGEDDGAVSDEINSITTHLRALRRDLKLCARIEGDIPRIEEAVRSSDPQRRPAYEKTDKGRPGRDSAAGAGVPGGDAREH